MSAYTVLELAQEASKELGLARPSTLFATDSFDNDATAPKLLRMLTRTARDLAQRHDWQELRRENTWEATGSANQPAACRPADFLRFVAGANDTPTFWNRTARQPMVGPLSSGEWQTLQAEVGQNVVNQFYWRQNTLYINPVPASGTDFYYEYITGNMVINTGGAYSLLPGANTDTFLFIDDEILILGAMWRYLSNIKEDYAETFREYEKRIYEVWHQNDGPSRTIDMSRTPAVRLPKPGPQDYRVT